MIVRKEYRFDMEGQSFLVSPHKNSVSFFSYGDTPDRVYIDLNPEHIEDVEKLLLSLKAIRAGAPLEPASS